MGSRSQEPIPGASLCHELVLSFSGDEPSAWCLLGPMSACRQAWSTDLPHALWALPFSHGHLHAVLGEHAVKGRLFLEGTVSPTEGRPWLPCHPALTACHRA